MYGSDSSTGNQLFSSPRRRVALGLAGVVATGALALGLAFGGGAASTSYADESATGDAATATASGATTAYDAITLPETVASEVLPSVGSVYCTVTSGTSQGIAQGSCVVLSADGHIVTNYHVIEGASQVKVILNGTTYDAEVVGSDPSSDIAVLKVDPGDAELTPIEFGDSSAVRVGQWVMTLGTPYGESESVSSGIVSGVSRTASLSLDSTEAYYVGMIQSDAMINSGSSGGAMVNADGQLIGITTLSSSESGDWAGMSFAIPSNYVKNVVDQIVEKGTVSHPLLGVSVADLMSAYHQYYYDGGSNSSILGAYVAKVTEGSGAAEAGIQAGDVITAIDGEEVYYADELIIQVRSHQIGDTVTLTVNRDGEELQIDVTLGSDEVLATTTVEDEVVDGSGSTEGYGNGYDGSYGDQTPGWGGYGPGQDWGWGRGGNGGGSYGGGNGGYGNGFGGWLGGLFGGYGNGNNAIAEDAGTAA